MPMRRRSHVAHPRLRRWRESLAARPRHKLLLEGSRRLRHRCQVARPRWCSPFDFDGQQALATREHFLAEFSDEPVLIIGTHFATPTAGHIVSDGETYRFAI